MSTIDSDTSTSEIGSPDHLLKQILNFRSNAFIQKSLYEFKSVEYNFNVELVPKPPNTNNSSPSIGIGTLSGNSNTPIRAMNLNKETNPVPLVEIMLPVKEPDKPKGSSGRACEQLPRSKLDEKSFTPIQLFKYSRFRRTNLDNYSTPKVTSRGKIFTCSISPIGKQLEKFNSPAKTTITSPPVRIPPTKRLGTPNGNLSHGKLEYYCSHNKTGRSSHHKTITKSKYMSLTSISTNVSITACNSKTVTEPVSMSVSEVTRRTSNVDMSDSSSSDSSQEIPNINDETSFYLSKTLIDITTKQSVENKNTVPRKDTDVYSDDAIDCIELETDLNDSDCIQNQEQMRDVLQSPFNGSVEPNMLTEDSASSSQSSVGRITINVPIDEGTLCEDNNLAEVNKDICTKVPSPQNEGAITEEMEDDLQRIVYDGDEQTMLPEESNINPINNDEHLQQYSNLATLNEKAEEEGRDLQPLVNDNIEPNILTDESNSSSEGSIGCTNIIPNLQKNIHLVTPNNAMYTNVPHSNYEVTVTEEVGNDVHSHVKDNINRNMLTDESNSSSASNLNLSVCEPNPNEILPFEQYKLAEDADSSTFYSVECASKDHSSSECKHEENVQKNISINMESENLVDINKGEKSTLEPLTEELENSLHNEAETLSLPNQAVSKECSRTTLCVKKKAQEAGVNRTDLKTDNVQFEITIVTEETENAVQLSVKNNIEHSDPCTSRVDSVRKDLTTSELDHDENLPMDINGLNNDAESRSLMNQAVNDITKHAQETLRSTVCIRQSTRLKRSAYTELCFDYTDGKRISKKPKSKLKKDNNSTLVDQPIVQFEITTVAEEKGNAVQSPVQNNIEPNILTVDADPSTLYSVECASKDHPSSECKHEENVQKNISINMESENLVDINKGEKSTLEPLTEELENSLHNEAETLSLTNQAVSKECSRTTLCVNKKAQEAGVNRTDLNRDNLQSTVKSIVRVRQSARLKKLACSKPDSDSTDRRKKPARNKSRKAIPEKINSKNSKSRLQKDNNSPPANQPIVQFEITIVTEDTENAVQSPVKNNIEHSDPSTSRVDSVRKDLTTNELDHDENLPMDINGLNNDAESLSLMNQAVNDITKHAQETLRSTVCIRQSTRLKRSAYTKLCSDYTDGKRISKKPKSKLKKDNNSTLVDQPIVQFEITTVAEEKGNAVQSPVQNNILTVDADPSKSTVKNNSKSIPSAKNESSSPCTIGGPRRSSRAPKPNHAFWLTGPRRIIPVIRNVNDLADHYDSKIPIILMPPKVLSNKAMGNLLLKLSDRMRH